MRKIQTEREFEMLWNEAEALICDFSASWCAPCRMLEHVLKKPEGAYPGIVFAKVDIDKNKGLSDAHEVECVPTLLFVDRGKVIRRMAGLAPYDDFEYEAQRLLDASKEKR